MRNTEATLITIVFLIAFRDASFAPFAKSTASIPRLPTVLVILADSFVFTIGYKETVYLFVRCVKRHVLCMIREVWTLSALIADMTKVGLTRFLRVLRVDKQ